MPELGQASIHASPCHATPAWRWAFLVLLALGQPARPADAVALLTIVDGSAFVVRPAGKFAVAAGVRVLPDDLVETAGGSSLARIELPDGTRVDLGAKTRIQWNPPQLRKAGRPALYLLSGWLKLAVAQAGPAPQAAASAARAGGAAFATPRFDCAAIAGTVLAQADDNANAAFIERGSAWLADRHDRATELVRRNEGDFIRWAGGGAANISSLPDHDFASSMPAAFQNTIAPRYGAQASRQVAPVPAGPFRYAEVEPWLDAEPQIRRQFVAAWRAKANEADFRARLIESMARHPEWDRVIHPELYLPKPAAPVPGPVATPPGPAGAMAGAIQAN